MNLFLSLYGIKISLIFSDTQLKCSSISEENILRIIAGESKGRVLLPVKGKNTRPTSDKVKESIFNIIQDRIYNSVVLDLFAGTGNMGFEALSRGSLRAFFIDRDTEAIRVIKKNCQSLGYEARSEIFKSDANHALMKLSQKSILFDIIFIDPPYSMGLGEALLSTIDRIKVLHRNGIVIVEHDAKSPLANKVASLHCRDIRNYGGTGVSFYTGG